MSTAGKLQVEGSLRSCVDFLLLRFYRCCLQPGCVHSILPSRDNLLCELAIHVPIYDASLRTGHKYLQRVRDRVITPASPCKYVDTHCAASRGATSCPCPTYIVPSAFVRLCAHIDWPMNEYLPSSHPRTRWHDVNNPTCCTARPAHKLAHDAPRPRMSCWQLRILQISCFDPDHISARLHTGLSFACLKAAAPQGTLATCRQAPAASRSSLHCAQAYSAGPQL